MQRTRDLYEILGDPALQNGRSLSERFRAVDEGLWLHAQIVASYVGSMAHLLPGVSEEERAQFRDGAWLHDIGKLAISPEILLKSTPLSDEEWRTIRAHPALGAKFISGSVALAPVAPLVGQHHEWHDGRGYPNGLRGNQIELGARLIGVADAFDAMTSWRPYRSRMSDDEAIVELRRCSGTQFDPEIVELFIRATQGNRMGTA